VSDLTLNTQRSQDIAVTAELQNSLRSDTKSRGVYSLNGYQTATSSDTGEIVLGTSRIAAINGITNSLDIQGEGGTTVTTQGNVITINSSQDREPRVRSINGINSGAVEITGAGVITVTNQDGVIVVGSTTANTQINVNSLLGNLQITSTRITPLFAGSSVNLRGNAAGVVMGPLTFTTDTITSTDAVVLSGNVNLGNTANILITDGAQGNYLSFDSTTRQFKWITQLPQADLVAAANSATTATYIDSADLVQSANSISQLGDIRVTGNTISATTGTITFAKPLTLGTDSSIRFANITTTAGQEYLFITTQDGLTLKPRPAPIANTAINVTAISQPGIVGSMVMGRAEEREWRDGVLTRTTNWSNLTVGQSFVLGNTTSTSTTTSIEDVVTEFSVPYSNSLAVASLKNTNIYGQQVPRYLLATRDRIVSATYRTYQGRHYANLFFETTNYGPINSTHSITAAEFQSNRAYVIKSINDPNDTLTNVAYHMDYMPANISMTQSYDTTVPFTGMRTIRLPYRQRAQASPYTTTYQVFTPSIFAVTADGTRAMIMGTATTDRFNTTTIPGTTTTTKTASSSTYSGGLTFYDATWGDFRRVTGAPTTRASFDFSNYANGYYGGSLNVEVYGRTTADISTAAKFNSWLTSPGVITDLNNQLNAAARAGFQNSDGSRYWTTIIADPNPNWAATFSIILRFTVSGSTTTTPAQTISYYLQSPAAAAYHEVDLTADPEITAYTQVDGVFGTNDATGAATLFSNQTAVFTKITAQGSTYIAATAGAGGQLLRWTQQTPSWTNLTRPEAAEIQFLKSIQGRLFLGTTKLWVSTDQGSNWTATDIVIDTAVTDITYHEARQRYYAVAGTRILVSATGTNWSLLTTTSTATTRIMDDDLNGIWTIAQIPSQLAVGIYLGATQTQTHTQVIEKRIQTYTGPESYPASSTYLTTGTYNSLGGVIDGNIAIFSRSA
jgi:hypothetical protein